MRICIHIYSNFVLYFSFASEYITMAKLFIIYEFRNLYIYIYIYIYKWLKRNKEISLA